ncbi:hypothetical protein MKW92_046795, partial [Papaver armeniacum]
MSHIVELRESRELMKKSRSEQGFKDQVSLLSHDKNDLSEKLPLQLNVLRLKVASRLTKWRSL